MQRSRIHLHEASSQVHGVKELNFASMEHSLIDFKIKDTP
jgi:hypothetical protein